MKTSKEELIKIIENERQKICFSSGWNIDKETQIILDNKNETYLFIIELIKNLK